MWNGFQGERCGDILASFDAEACSRRHQNSLGQAYHLTFNFTYTRALCLPFTILHNCKATTASLTVGIAFCCVSRSTSTDLTAAPKYSLTGHCRASESFENLQQSHRAPPSSEAPCPQNVPKLYRLASLRRLLRVSPHREARAMKGSKSKIVKTPLQRRPRRFNLH